MPFCAWLSMGLHPLVIYLPIILLSLAPVFLLPGLILRGKRNRVLVISALILLAAGTASLYVVAHFGYAASCQLSTQVDAVLRHQKLATETKALFTVVTGIFSLLLLLTWRLELRVVQLTPVLLVAVILFYAMGMELLASTMQRGSELVHGFGP